MDVVSGHVELRKAGRSFKAACPFHTEKTPSFVVSPERQSWHCFGACATGGDVFSFVMRMEGIEFREALRLLAQRAGVAMDRGGSQEGRYDALYSVNQVASGFFQEVLRTEQGRRAREYLERRQVSPQAVSQFGLGLSPPGWEGLKSHLASHEVDLEQAVAAGVLRRAEDGWVGDFFHGRLMYPIHDRQGRVAGFGARALDDSMPKYINTASTPIFDKRSILYGLHLADGAIRGKQTGVVVEGYMDVIAAHQHGYDNVVASMGTALTEQQVAQLKALASEFVLALDPDTAGQEATLRSLESSWRIFEGSRIDGRRRPVGPIYHRQPLRVGIAELPEGRDPDALIREDSAAWEQLIEAPTPSEDFYIRSKVAGFDLSTTDGRSLALQVLAPVVTSSDGISQHHYLQKVAEALGVSDEALRASLGSLRPRPSRRQPDARQTSEVSASALAEHPEHSLEDYTLSLLLNRPELRESAAGFSPENFNKMEDRELFTRWLGCTTMEELAAEVEDPLRMHLSRLMEKSQVPTDRRDSEAALSQCLRRLEERHLRRLQESLLASEDGEGPPAKEIEAKVAEVNSQLKAVFARRVLSPTESLERTVTTI